MTSLFAMGFIAGVVVTVLGVLVIALGDDENGP